MRKCVAVVLMLCGSAGLAQSPLPPDRVLQNHAAYPESDSIAAWRGLAAGYVRKAIREQTLDKDAALNLRVDTVMAKVGAAVAGIDARFSRSSWRAVLINGFGLGATAFPGEIILVDAKFVRDLALTDDELALVLSHEAAHVIAGHGSAKLAFMAQILGKERLPTAHKALIEFLAKDSYATAFQPTALLQEREADRLGAEILYATGYDPRQALRVFDKLAALEAIDAGRPGAEADSHDVALDRKQTIAAVIDDFQAFEVRLAHTKRQFGSPGFAAAH